MFELGLAVVGLSGVGTSALAIRFVQNRFVDGPYIDEDYRFSMRCSIDEEENLLEIYAHQMRNVENSKSNESTLRRYQGFLCTHLAPLSNG